MGKVYNINEAGAYLTVNEISTYLNVSRSQAYELTHRSDFPVTHLGGSIRVPKEAFLVWVRLHTIIPRDVDTILKAAA